MSNIVITKIKRPARLQFLSYLGDLQGCGHIRVIFPFLLMNHYRQEDLMVQGFYLTNYIQDPEFYKQFTVVQFQRAATEAHWQMIMNFKKHIQTKYPLPVIYEIDDMLYNIPEWNYASAYYNKSEDIIKKIMSSVDAITVSTVKLKEMYSPFCKNINVIPNHLPKFLWGEVYPAHEYKDEDEKIKILWSGSQNHFATKQIVGNDSKGGDFRNELLNFIIKTTNIYEWHFVGAMPDELIGVKTKIHFHTWKNIFEYPQYLKAIEPDITIAPLVDNEFNSCKCIVGNSMVVSYNGIYKIKDFYDIGSDYIWQEIDWKKVERTIKYEKRKTIKLKTYNGYEIEGTENHRIRCNDDFRSLANLKIGDKVDLGFFEYPNIDYQELSAPLFLTKKLDLLDTSNFNEDLLPKVKINERWGRMIGYILGDGHISESNNIAISCNIEYQDIIDDIIKFAKEIGLFKLSFAKKKVKKGKEYRDGKGIDIHLNSRNLTWFMAEKIGFRGVHKKNLNVPEIIFKSPKSVVKEFIRGLFESDGTVNNCSCSFTTKHEQLANEIQFLLLGFKIISRIYKQKNGIYYYTLILNRQACDIFYKEINFISEKKKERLRNITEKNHSNAYKEWELKDEIIEISHGENDVYDIQVPDGEYYLANGIISHNSNIKALEFTAVGAAGIYSDVEPYKFMTVRAKTDEEIISNIESFAKDIDLRARVFRTDYDRVRNQLWWEENNNIKRFINSYLGLFGKCL